MLFYSVYLLLLQTHWVAVRADDSISFLWREDAITAERVHLPTPAAWTAWTECSMSCQTVTNWSPALKYRKKVACTPRSAGTECLVDVEPCEDEVPYCGEYQLNVTAAFLNLECESVKKVGGLPKGATVQWYRMDDRADEAKRKSGVEFAWSAVETESDKPEVLDLGRQLVQGDTGYYKCAVIDKNTLLHHANPDTKLPMETIYRVFLGEYRFPYENIIYGCIPVVVIIGLLFICRKKLKKKFTKTPEQKAAKAKQKAKDIIRRARGELTTKQRKKYRKKKTKIDKKIAKEHKKRMKITFKGMYREKKQAVLERVLANLDPATAEKLRQKGYKALKKREKREAQADGATKAMGGENLQVVGHVETSG